MTKVCYLLGIMPRSGTNFLENHLILHPNCKAPGPVWEDFMVSHLPQLDKGSSHFHQRWDHTWFNDSDRNYFDEMKRYIGDGMNRFLLSQLSGNEEYQYLVTKTPTTRGIKLFNKYFTENKLIIIIRDGRSLVESGMKSFHWDFEKAVYDWAKNAKEIRLFLKANPDLSYLVKFEELSSNPESTMQGVMAYLDLDSEMVAAKEQVNLHVSGSSELKNSADGIHWRPVEKDSNFKPNARHLKWSQFKKKVFWYIAGKEMLHFDYVSDMEITPLDRVWIPIYLMSWPIRAPFNTIYRLLVNKVFNLRTN